MVIWLVVDRVGILYKHTGPGVLVEVTQEIKYIVGCGDGDIDFGKVLMGKGVVVTELVQKS